MLLSINNRIHDKPSKPGGYWYSKGFKPHDLQMSELAEIIKKGHAFSSQFADGHRTKGDFIASGFLAADVDSGLRIEDAFHHHFVNSFAGMLYTTASHTPDNHHFRIVFELEHPITDERTYRLALLGLIARVGSDEACKDGARLFYGNTKAEVMMIGQVLCQSETETLIEQGRQIEHRASYQRQSMSDLRVDESPSLVVANAFPRDLVVHHATGLMDIHDVPLCDRSILCPFHIDTRPSAYVVVSENGTRGIACQRCGVTRWPSEAPCIQFRWHRELIESASEPVSSDSPEWSSLQHKLGTRIDLLDQRYLPDLNIQDGVTFIRSPKNTGKTEALSREVARMQASGKRILLVGHRRTLLGNLAKRLDLPFYENEPNRIAWREAGCLAVSVDSLAKFLDSRTDRFDVLVIDESEQVTAHFKSDTLADKRSLAYMTLEFYLRNTPCIVCSDADAGEMTAGLMQVARGTQYPDRFIINQFKPTGDVPELHLYDKEGALHADLLSSVQKGHRCFVATNSKAAADRMYAAILASAQDKRLLLITRDTSNHADVVKFIRRPSKETLNYDVVIYSPSLSTGVDISFDTEGVVDAVYGFFYPNITTHFEIDQQISRVRKPKSIRLWITDATYRYQTDPIVLRDEMIENRDLSSRIVSIDASGNPLYGDDNLLPLIAWITAVQRSSLSNLRSNFITLREENGYTVERVEDLGLGASPVPRRKVTTPEIADDIRSAKPISSREYEERRRRGLKGLNDQQRIQMLRHEIEAFYGRDVPLDDALIALDLSGKFRSKVSEYRNLIGPEEASKQTDEGEVSDAHRSSYDWQHRVRKKVVLTTLFEASGLLRGGRFRSSLHVCKPSLADFISSVAQHKKELRQILALDCRADLHEAPVIQLKELLKLVGLSLKKSHTKTSGGEKVVYYRLDEEQLGLMQRLADTRHQGGLLLGFDSDGLD